MKATTTTKWLFILLALSLVLVACERPLQQPQPDVTIESPDSDNPVIDPIVPAETAPAGEEAPDQPEDTGDPDPYPAPDTGDEGVEDAPPADDSPAEDTPTDEGTDEPVDDAPDVPAGAQSYTVQSGDTLGAIAEQFGVTVAEIAAANDIINIHDLDVGQVLVIPEPGTIDPGTGEEVVTEEQSYTVQFGDSLYGIGLAFGFTVDELVAYNNLANPDTLSVGDIILIPPSDYELPSE